MLVGFAVLTRASDFEDRSSIWTAVDRWRPEHGVHVWELSGRHEGDIAIDDYDRNGLINKTSRWPAGIVPYHIDVSGFSAAQIDTIETAINEYHQRTCLKFRKKRPTDQHYIEIVASDSGCWSSVGMQHKEHDNTDGARGAGGQNKKQLLNLQTPNCVTFGVVLHELMHAIGFYHQQSASNRDEFVRINWDNIKPGREHNFNKYADDVVSDFGIEYDYASVMHYSALAFSKNTKPTIEPLRDGVEIGLRRNFSDSDVEKINRMYQGECDKRKMVEHEDITDLFWYFENQ